MFSSSACMVLFFIIKFLMLLEFILTYGLRKASNFIFFQIAIQLSQYFLLKRLPSDFRWHLCHICIDSWVCFWTVCSVLATCLFMCLYYFNFRDFVLCLNIWLGLILPTAFFQYFPSYSYVLFFHMRILESTHITLWKNSLVFLLWLH